MSVIVTGMDAPKNCKSCRIEGQNPFGFYCPLIAERFKKYSYEELRQVKRKESCPLKSVGGLIAAIKQIDVFKYQYSQPLLTSEVAEATIEEIIQIIKDYCEVE